MTPFSIPGYGGQIILENVTRYWVYKGRCWDDARKAPVLVRHKRRRWPRIIRKLFNKPAPTFYLKEASFWTDNILSEPPALMVEYAGSRTKEYSYRTLAEARAAEKALHAALVRASFCRLPAIEAAE